MWKNKLWLMQLPIILACTFAYYVIDIGVKGEIENTFLRDRVFTALRRVSTIFSDIKFRVRGPQPPKNKIIIVEVDSDSIAQFGRWPWHRDKIAKLITRTFESGAKIVGLDMVFSEEDQRVPPLLADALNKSGMGNLAFQAETDPQLAFAIDRFKDNLVLGWTSEGVCQPLYSTPEDCPVSDPEALKQIPVHFDKFAHIDLKLPADYDATRTPLQTVLTFIPDLPMYNGVAGSAGYFNALPDGDGIIRRTDFMYLSNGKGYPSLPLEMARLALGRQGGKAESVEAVVGSDMRLQSFRFVNAGLRIPVTPVGGAEINFRGPDRTFTYVSAVDVMEEPADPAAPMPADEAQRRLASTSHRSLLKDAYVLIGVSALGVYDMRAFPFSSNVPGVEGHATILDNLLSNDFLTRGSGWFKPNWIYFLMLVGGLAFAYGAQRLEAIPALLLFVTVFGGFGFFDIKVLFARNINWDLSFMLIEYFAIFVFTVAVKYVLEEQNKKFVRGAFSKYVAPAVVDSILKDPAKLTVGGEKREMTVLFSDIRSFTTFSERMDAKALASFLNDYLGIQTKIVFNHEGTLDKYIGDAIMAFWGAPLDQPHHSRNCCLAAISMMRALGENKARFKQQYGVDVEIGIGLNSGHVSVGNMGSNDNFAYTVIGDHVNLASRLEGLTKYYGVAILTSRFTFDCVESAGDPLPPHRVLDMVKVKGKKNAVELIQVLERDLGATGLEEFARARELYRAQKWNEAIEAFKRANQLLIKPEDTRMDGPCAMYIERCEELKASPPGAEWDGSWEMHSK